MSQTKSIVIAAYKRTPFTRAYKGDLSKVRSDDFGAQLIRGLVDQTQIDPETIEDLLVGNAFPEAEQGFNVARLMVFLAGLSNSTAGATVNRFCGSSMTTIHQAAGNIAMGAGEAYICAGIESMSHVPMTGFNPMPNPELMERMPQAYIGMGETAENLAKKYKIDRTAQDGFAVASHQKAAKAQDDGKFKDEIVAIKHGGKEIKEDGCIRGDSSLESLSTLDPAFDKNGTVTAGTSSPLTDGASAVLVCTEEYAKKNNLEPLARIRSIAVSGCLPEIMGIGPVNATKKALERAGLTVDDIDVFELNEAFAAQSLAVIEELKIPLEKLNLDGGAIALGHPLGASGGRITGKAAQLLKREKGKYALATMCIGGGQGIATVLEAL